MTNEKIIASVFDKTIEAIGIATKAICTAIENKKENRIVIYDNQECQLIGISQGNATLNTGGLAFCIALPDGTVRNVQDTECRLK